MREILFKAKTEGGRWIKGDLIHYESGEMAILEKPFSKYGREATEIVRRTEVLPKTICQYTGLTDRNGRKIWENDLVVNDVIFGVVTWDVKNARFVINDINDEYQDYSDWWNEVGVIGDIFDGPELLKGGAE